MSNRLATDANKSPKPPLPHPGAPPDAECTEKPPLAPSYRPYANKSGPPEPPYKPYAKKPGPPEPPYEPYKGM